VRRTFGGHTLDRDGLEERLQADAADRTSPACGREDVVAPGRIVAGNDRRPRTDEDRARVADPGCQRLGVVAEHDEMLRSDRVHLRDGRRGVPVDGYDAADGIGAVLCLCGELEVRDAGVRA
jgi:hypothetical protein